MSIRQMKNYSHKLENYETTKRRTRRHKLERRDARISEFQARVNSVDATE
eukprot:TRINITY_DN12729_c0_g1_i1.p2 TRINITY_DN12729_c0_g1~~TRINITY_DN12729_c0_g1_i1.p2  ORF type:complete len:50 (-),score=4.84 TRINITY_DN12729_c0_g1_i1:318-467(-)